MCVPTSEAAERVEQNDGITFVERVDNNDKETRTQELRPTDVLLGRGSGVAAHPGNQKFRELIRVYKPLYQSALRNQKMRIAAEVIEKIEMSVPPGRFVEKVMEGLYTVISTKRALEKTSQALRERITNGPSPTEASAMEVAVYPCEKSASPTPRVNHDRIFTFLNQTLPGVSVRPEPVKDTNRTCSHLDFPSQSERKKKKPSRERFLHSEKGRRSFGTVRTFRDEFSSEKIEGDESQFADAHEDFDTSASIAFECLRQGYL